MPLADKIYLFVTTVESRFDKFQLDYIYDTSKLIVGEKSIRIGFTYAHSWWSFKKRLLRDPRLPPCDELFTSQNLKIAGISYVKYHKAWAAEAIAFGLHDLLEGYRDKWTTESLPLPGGTIYIFSSDPDTFRSAGGDYTGDEFAFHPDQENVLRSGIGRGLSIEDSQVRIFSSHDHAQTYFYRLTQGIKESNPEYSEWKLYSVPLTRAVNDGFAERMPGPHKSLYVIGDDGKATPDSVRAARREYIAYLRRLSPSEDAFNVEFMCQPRKLGQLISGEQYDACVREEVPEYPAQGYRELFVGIDVARSRDLTVCATVARKYGDNGVPYYCVASLLWIKNATIPEQMHRIEPVVDEGQNPKLVGGFCDMGAVGRALSDAIRDINPMVEPIAMGGGDRGSKARAANGLISLIQTKRIAMPKHQMCRQSILSMRRDVTPKGQTSYVGGTEFDHGDFFWAIALAVLAAGETGDIELTTAA